ncbi:MAG: molecular chaperone DnaK [Bacteroidetes bacterium SW_7_64_58]|jgi:RNA polymerase-binding protein DksA|nr:MAG: molecular chaperone DnaK [Bacteroidetes bacterium QH_2_64_74]PSQ95612.1 MAG: molecular chaperone DnaK [Bacteroidetes bacterium SW_7_64_58]
MANDTSNSDTETSDAPLHAQSGEGEDGEPERKTPFSDEELEHFRELILQRRREAKEEIEQMRKQVDQANEQSDDNTAYGIHMADAGTDAMEREKLHLMIARQQKYIGYLDRALERIDNKTYGICRVTGEPIAKKRLEAVPHTEISIDAKRAEKSS